MNWLTAFLTSLVGVLEFFKSYQTVVAAIGLLGLATYQMSQGDFSTALQNFMAAMAAFGISKTMIENQEAVLQMKHRLDRNLALQEKHIAVQEKEIK